MSCPTSNPATTLPIARMREFQTLLGAVPLAAFILWGMRSVRQAARSGGLRGPGLLRGVAYLPISGLFALNASVAEHWLYVPGAFLLGAALPFGPRPLTTRVRRE